MDTGKNKSMERIKNTHQYPKNGTLLKDKVILITGAASGIGKAVALSCARHQATLILLGRNPRKLESVHKEIKDECQNEVFLYPLNLETADDTHYADLAKTIEEHFGKLNGLLHNAATLGNISPMRHYQLQQWYKVMQTNVNAPMMLTQACLPLMEKSENSSIIWTTSGVAIEPVPLWGAYGVSKYANEYMMSLLAQEYDDTDLRCNAIDPGVVATGMRSKAFPGENPNELTKAQSITDTWLYLFSDDSIGVRNKIITP